MLIKNKNKIKALFSILFCFFIFSGVVNAFDFKESTGLDSTAEKTGHKEQALFGDEAQLETGAGTIIAAILSFVGVIFMVLLVYGGILWMTAGGNDNQVERARKIITESIIGLIVVMLAYAISVFLLSVFVN
jgi:hypothetical protein